jgi:SAM-dependent methyltransferase
MVLTGTRQRPEPREALTEVIWHDLECGGYRSDLSLWRELAERSPQDPVLEIGAGTGRVTLELARAGHRVTALDLDSRLLDALSTRAAGLDVEVVCADARSFDLGERRFGLCLAPMQTLQLLGAAGRSAFLRRARAHLMPGGLLACAVVTGFEYFDCTRGDPGPAPESARVQGADYVSRAIRVAALGDRVVIERARRILPIDGEAPARRLTRPPRHGTHVQEIAGERDTIELDLVGVEQLEREALAAGLRPSRALTIGGTEDYVASTVVMLHA